MISNTNKVGNHNNYQTTSQICLLVLGSISSKFNRHLGPIVDFIYAPVKYFPFKPCGFFSTSDSINDLKFCKIY